MYLCVCVLDRESVCEKLSDSERECVWKIERERERERGEKEREREVVESQNESPLAASFWRVFTYFLLGLSTATLFEAHTAPRVLKPKHLPSKPWQSNNNKFLFADNFLKVFIKNFSACMNNIQGRVMQFNHNKTW